MADMREDMAAAIAAKYIELEELARDAGVYGAIRLDWARYGQDGLDEVLEGFRSGLEEFDRSLNGVMSDGDYVRHALSAIMEERGMDAAQRARFLSVMSSFAEQSGADRLMGVLEGQSDSVLRALVTMSGEADARGGDEQALMDGLCRAAQQRQDAQRLLDLREVSGETGDELLRCYAAYCVLRDGQVEGLRLDDDCLRFIGASVRAGQQRARVIDDMRAGRITGEKAAEALRAVAEVLLVALALLLSGAAGVLAGACVMRLVGVLLGFAGALGGVALALGLLCALPVGVKVTCDAIRLCAKAGLWLEQRVMEPGAERAAELTDRVLGWLSDEAVPAAQRCWSGACDAGRRVRDGARAAWDGMQPRVEQAAEGAMDWLERAAGETDAALGRLLKAFRLSGEEG